MGNAFTVSVRASYVSNVAQGVRQDAGAITGLSTSVERAAGRSTNATRSLGLASAIAGKLLLVGVGGAMAVSAKAAIEFESSMAEVAKTTDMAGSSFERGSGPLFTFGQALRDMALRVPIDVNDLAKLAALGGQLGIETPNLLRFTEVMAAIGVSTNMAATEAAQGFARFANIMRTPQSDFERLGNVVVELGNNLATTESEILKFGTRLAPIGRIVGMTEEEVFALAGALTSLGVPAERGGTALQRWFLLAKQAVDSGGESLERFARVAGISAEAFAEMFRDSPAQAIAAFVKGLDEINTSGGDVKSTLEGLSLAEQRTVQVLLSMAGGYETVVEAIDMANEASEEGTALFEEAARRYGTTASQIQLLGASFKDLQLEIGNAILGSGGLKFAIDAFREFFKTLKDNLPGIRNFLLILAGLGAARLFTGVIANFASLIIGVKKFGVATKAAFTGTQKLSAGMKAARTASGLLSIGMNAALGIAGLVAAAWAWQAVKAAELKAAIQGLNDAVKDGVDPVIALADTLDDMISEKDIKALERYGITTFDLAKALMEGKTAAEAFPEVFAEIAAGAQGTRQEMLEAGKSAVLLGRIFGQAREASEGLFRVRRNELVRALQETGSSIPLERMRQLADQAIELHGIHISAEWFADWATGASATERELNKVRFMLGLIGEEIEARALHWSEFAFGFESAEEAVEEFSKNAEADLKAFNEFMAENFAAADKIVRGGFPVWEEYKRHILGETTLTWQKVLESQRRFLQDQRDFIEKLPTMIDMGASDETIAWLESLEPAVRAAIARMNDAQLQELIDGQNEIQAEMTGLVTEYWEVKYPAIVHEGFSEIIAALLQQSAEMGLVGDAAAQHMSDGLMTRFEGMGTQDKLGFLRYIEEVFSNKDFLNAIGVGEGNAFIEGLLAALRRMAARAMPVIKGQLDQIKDKTNTASEIASPSKWWQRVGHQWIEGLQLGIKDEMGNLARLITPGFLMPTVSAGIGSTNTNTYNRANNYALTINTGASGDGIAKEAQTMLTLLNIVSGVEAGAGR